MGCKTFECFQFVITIYTYKLFEYNRRFRIGELDKEYLSNFIKRLEDKMKLPPPQMMSKEQRKIYKALLSNLKMLVDGVKTKLRELHFKN